MADVSAKPGEGNPDTSKSSGRKSYSGMPFDELDHFVNEDDQYLFCKTWKPKGEPKALLLILPSALYHSEWFNGLADSMVDLGVLVFGHDYVGHGESEGHRIHFDENEIYLRDIRQHINIMKSEYPDLPLYVFGQSMGGSLAIILAGENPNLFKGLIVSSPLIISNILPSGAKLFFMKAASLVMPQLQISLINPEQFIKTPQSVEKHKNDSRIYHGSLKLQAVLNFVRVRERVHELLPEISVPVLVLCGSKDPLTEFSGTEEFMRVAKSNDKTLKVYEGAMHYLLHETEDIAQRFINDIKEWFQNHMSK